MKRHTFRIAHLFGGIGGSGIGAQAAEARFGDHVARFETAGSVDFDQLACTDFERLVRAPTLCADMHEVQPADLRRLFGDTAPDVVMSSPPCKGYSGLLGNKRAAEPKYELMNRLLLTSLNLIVSTWAEPPAIIFFENVPRIMSRGKKLVADSVALLEAAGYAVTTGTHDCGELGYLAQHRRRWFLLARHRGRVPQFVYQPPIQRVRACGEVLGPLPMPGDVAAGGPMHSVPGLSWRNWVRLSLIPPGGDWRDLPGVLEEGQARREKFRRDPVTAWADPAETVTGPGGSAAANVADPRAASWSGRFGVKAWDEPGGTVTGQSLPNNGAFTVADPRPVSFGNVDNVTPWSEPVGTITRSPAPSSGAAAVADPRYTNIMQVAGWDEPTRTVVGASRVGSGALSVADPRPNKPAWQRVAGVTSWGSPAPVITAGAKIHAGAFQVDDPRVHRVDVALGCSPRVGAYRVLAWEVAAQTISGSMQIDNGAAAVADPRPAANDPRWADLFELNPQKPPPFVPVIVAADGTWHRPLTTFELAILQSFPSTMPDGSPLLLAGTSHTRWREGIGNAVPPDAAKAIAEQLLQALLLARLDVWQMSSNEIWVRPELRI